MYQEALPRIAPRLDALVRQKVALQLLPDEALRRLPIKAHIVHPVVAVAAPNLRSGCWESLSIVQSRLESGPVPVVTIGGWRHAPAEARRAVRSTVAPV